MGAWGHKSFENDDALDWLAELTGEDEGVMQLEAAIETVAGAEHDEDVELTEACAALAAAELIAAAHGQGVDRLPDDAAAWLRVHRDQVLPLGIARARSAVQRVLNASELRACWDEQGEDAGWHQDVRELSRRLSV